MKKLIFTIFAVSLTLLIVSCSDWLSNSEGPGRLVIKVTDDPFDISYIESATVTITKVEIRKVCDSICDGNPYLVLSEDTAVIDLIDLRNGITETLVDIEVPDGDYDLVRLYVEEAGLTLKDNPDPYALKVPSGKQTGIKLFIDPVLSVEGGLTSELLLDFDLSKSFVLRGNMHHNNGFIFKPVVRASNLTTAGRIEGMVMDTAKVKIGNAKVWVMKDTVYATTFSDTTAGRYALIGLPADTYSLFATKEGYDTASFEGVVVKPGLRVIKDIVLHKK